MEQTEPHVVDAEKLKALCDRYAQDGTLNARLLAAAFPGTLGVANARYSRFLRAGLDGLVNLDHILSVEIKDPPRHACAHCQERGTVIVNDRRAVCPRCGGAGSLPPAEGETAVTLTLTTGKVLPFRFAKPTEARGWFEYIAHVTTMPSGSKEPKS